jgi:hypothetical protein
VLLNKIKPNRLAALLVGFLLCSTVHALEFQSPIKLDDDEPVIPASKKPVEHKPPNIEAKEKPVEHKPPNIQPFEIPTFTGAPVDYHNVKPAIDAKKKIDGDAIFQIINRCYPLKSGFGLEINLRGGVNYKPTPSTGSTTVQTYDSQSYYAGIVANMPLYSDIEIDKDRKVEYQRREQTAMTIKEMLTAVAAKRRAERMMGLYSSLEKRAQARISTGVAPVDEQIGYLEKVATTQGELDAAEAAIEGARLALIGQCRPEVLDEVNNYILSEIQ